MTRSQAAVFYGKIMSATTLPIPEGLITHDEHPVQVTDEMAGLWFGLQGRSSTLGRVSASPEIGAVRFEEVYDD